MNDNPLFQLQQTIYSSKNYTRRRLHQSRFGWVIAAIKSHAPHAPVSLAVEYGPGSGIYLPILAEELNEVLGADVEQAYLSGIEQLALNNDAIRLVVDDIQKSKFEAGTFGLVLCSEVLEHVPKPELALKTIARILRPGGIAIITTPQKYSLMELSCKLAFLPGIIQLVRLIYREPILETGHISLRSYGDFTAAISACGLKIIEHKKLGLYVPLIAEFGGEAGGRFIERLEDRLKNSRLSWMLWTQAYVLRKADA